jgi:hypothetical protein
VIETGIELVDGDTFSPDEWEKKWEIKFDEFVNQAPVSPAIACWPPSLTAPSLRRP